MKSGWQSEKLGEVCTFLNRGISPKYLDEGGVCVLNQKCVRDHTVNYELSRRHDSEAKTVSAARFVQIGDVLVNSTGTGTLGRVAQVRDEPGEPTTVDSHVTIVRPKPGTFHLDFFGYMLVVIEEAIKEAGDGCGGQTELARSVLAERFLVSYPTSISEQQRLAGILDESFDSIATAKANAEKNLQNARALFESHLQSIFTQRGLGWVEKLLGEVCDLQNGYAFKSSSYIEQSNTLNIRMSSIRPGGTFDAEHNQRFLPDSFAKEFSAFLLKEGDLIIAMTDMAGDPKILGVPTLVENQLGMSFLMNQRVGKLHGFSGEVLVPYLRYFLTSPTVRNYYKSKSAGGLQINISKGDILSVRIPIPSIATQTAMITQLDSLSGETQRLESIYQHKLDALDELKKSLLHQAFSGQL